jgi:polyhydroxyalkanoate synthesis regulator phasin
MTMSEKKTIYTIEIAVKNDRAHKTSSVATDTMADGIAVASALLYEAAKLYDAIIEFGEMSKEALDDAIDDAVKEWREAGEQ